MISVRAEGLDRVSAALGRFSVTKAFTSFADGAAPRIAAGLRDYAPVGKERGDDTKPHRHLRDSIRHVRRTEYGRLTLIFTSDVPQAAFVIEGTRAHPIDPIPPNTLLSWIDENSGSRVFARHVDHPGTQANPFPRHYIEFHRAGLQSEFARAVQRVFHDTLGGI